MHHLSRLFLMNWKNGTDGCHRGVRTTEKYAKISGRTVWYEKRVLLLIFLCVFHDRMKCRYNILQTQYDLQIACIGTGENERKQSEFFWIFFEKWFDKVKNDGKLGNITNDKIVCDASREIGIERKIADGGNAFWNTFSGEYVRTTEALTRDWVSVAGRVFLFDLCVPWKIESCDEPESDFESFE